jgi:hypothetical protein
VEDAVKELVEHGFADVVVANNNSGGDGDVKMRKGSGTKRRKERDTVGRDLDPSTTTKEEGAAATGGRRGLGKRPPLRLGVGHGTGGAKKRQKLRK